MFGILFIKQVDYLCVTFSIAMLPKRIWILVGFMALVISLPIKLNALDTDSLVYIIDHEESDSSKIKAILELSEELYMEYPDSAFIYLQEASDLVNESGLIRYMPEILLLEGQVYKRLNDHPKELTKYLEAKSIIEDNFDYKHDIHWLRLYVKIQNAIGIVFFNTVKYEEGLEYLAEVIQLIEESDLTADEPYFEDMYFRTFANQGAINLQMGNWDQADFYFTKSMNLLKPDDWNGYAMILNNLGIVAKERGNLEKAMEYHEKALNIRLKHDDYMGIAQSYNNLGSTATEMGDIESAFEYVKKSLEVSEQHKYTRSAVISYRALQYLSNEMKDYKGAYEASKNYMTLHDSLMNTERLNMVTQLEMQERFDDRIKEVEYKNKELEAEKDRREMVYLIILGFSVLGLVIFVLFYSLQRSKLKRQRLEAEKYELQRKSLEMEKEKLELDLDYRNKELATNVMYLARTNEFITSISEKLLQSKLSFTRENQIVISRIIKELQDYSDQDTWKEFEIRFQQVHSDFYTRLNEEFPNLSANEKKLCAFLKLNMTTKEISALTYQSPNSITVARSRLRKKLGIDQEENLSTFLESL
jgi:tetratricopeptide (TPR) repeat protein